MWSERRPDCLLSVTSIQLTPPPTLPLPSRHGQPFLCFPVVSEALLRLTSLAGWRERQSGFAEARTSPRVWAGVRRLHFPSPLSPTPPRRLLLTHVTASPKSRSPEAASDPLKIWGFICIGSLKYRCSCVHVHIDYFICIIDNVV